MGSAAYNGDGFISGYGALQQQWLLLSVADDGGCGEIFHRNDEARESGMITLWSIFGGGGQYTVSLISDVVTRAGILGAWVGRMEEDQGE
jgi:hypothetical protein